MSTPRVLVAVIDDHPVFRHGLAHAVTEAPDMELVAAAASVEDYEARKSAVAPTRPPDIVILDLGLPGKRGAAAVEHICGLGSKVLVVSADGSQEAVVDAVGAGAPGYLTKSSEPYEVLVALRTIANGITYVSAALATFLVRSHRKEPDDAPWAFTQREREVLRRLAEGSTDAEIATELYIAISTVRGHLDRIRDKTGLRRRTQLASLVRPTVPVSPTGPFRE